MAVTVNQSALERYTRFSREYLKDTNARQAAIRAGYSPRSAGAIANRLLKTDAVVELIDAERTRLEKSQRLSAESIALELAKIGYSNLQDYVTDTGQAVELSQLTREQSAALQEFSVTTTRAGSVTTTSKRVKLADKRAALIDLAKMLGYITERRDITSGGRPISNEWVITPVRPAGRDAITVSGDDVTVERDK